METGAKSDFKAYLYRFESLAWISNRLLYKYRFIHADFVSRFPVHTFHVSDWC